MATGYVVFAGLAAALVVAVWIRRRRFKRLLSELEKLAVRIECLQEVVKLTALGSVVAVPELLYQARQAQSLTYSPTPIVVAAIVYFLMLWPAVRLLSRLENRALARR